jgi:hypothetical protein
MEVKMFAGFLKGGIHGEITRSMFTQMPRRDQDSILQNLYDKGYSIPEISRFLEMPAPTLYSRVNAHRGRGTQLNPA